MTRRDPITSETERPRYYSQFWIDVAGGKRDLTAGAAGELEAEAEGEPDFNQDFVEDEDFAVAAPETPPARPAAKKPAKDKKPEPVRPTITSLADLANIDLLMKNSAAMEGDEVPDLETGTIGDLEPFDSGEPAIVTDFDVDSAEEPEAEAAIADDTDEEFDDLEYEEDEDEDEWGGTRKPSKQQKKQQQNRRERRPGF